MNSDLISVIIPVYNVVEYLDECITSVINQTYQKLEVILVDDGSNDGSAEICDKWSEEHENIIVIHQNNSGVAVARNTGIDAARGSYIGFIDADDVISCDMYKELYNQIVMNDAELAYGVIQRMYGNQRDNDLTGECYLIEGENIINAHFGIGPRPHIGKSVCDKLFKRSLIGATRFKQGILQGEDNLFLTQLLIRSLRCVFLSKVLYFYRDERQGNSSTKGTISDGVFLNRVYVEKKILKLLLENDFNNAYEKEAITFYKELLTFYKSIYIICCKTRTIDSDYKKIKDIIFSERSNIRKSYKSKYSDYKYIIKYNLYFNFYMVYNLIIETSYLFSKK